MQRGRLEREFKRFKHKFKHHKKGHIIMGDIKADTAQLVTDAGLSDEDAQKVATDVAALVPNTPEGQLSQAVVDAVTTVGISKVFTVDAVVTDLVDNAGYTKDDNGVLTPPAETTPPAGSPTPPTS
jgi:hypothetical protein